MSRSERSGRYGSEQSRDEGNWRDRRDRDQERGYDSHRWGDDRRNDRHGDGERWWGRDSPEVGTSNSGIVCYHNDSPLFFHLKKGEWHYILYDFLNSLVQRGRKRRSSDGSDDGHHSDGDYCEQDYRGDPGEEKESKTIMLRGLSLNVTEQDVSVHVPLQ